MFPPPWKKEARKNRLPGHVDCQADFQHHAATKSSSSAPSLLWSEQRHHPNQQQSANLRRAVHDGHTVAAPIGAVGDGDRIRFEFRAIPHGASSRAETGGVEKNRYTIHAGEPHYRRVKGSSNRSNTKKRKRAPSTRRGPGNDRTGGGGVPSVSALSECSTSLDSGSRANSQTEECRPRDFSGLGRGWRDQLLLQALRETGEEMKRRRQTHREVRARRVAEEEEASIRSGGGGGSTNSHGSSHGSSLSMVTLQAGGEGRWKPPLSRRTREYLAANPAKVLRNPNSNNTHGNPTNTDTRGSPTKTKQEEQGRKQAKDDDTLRHRRRTRRIPSEHRSRGRGGTSTAKPTRGEERSLPPMGDTSSTNRGGARQVAAAGPSTSDKDEPERLSARNTARTSVGFGEGDETSAAAARRSSAAGKPGRRKTIKGSRNRMESKEEALDESGGGGMESVSLTTSVQVTVLEGIPVGEEGDSSGRHDGASGGSAEAGCGMSSSTDRLEGTAAISDGIGLPPLQHKEPRGSITNFIRVVGVDDRVEENADRETRLAAERSPSISASSDNNEEVRNNGRRRSTVLEVRQALAASKRAADEAAGADEAGPAEAGSKTVVPEERRQDPPPTPFRGTFWDDDDGEPTFPARRVSNDLHSGKRRGHNNTGIGVDCDAATVNSTVAKATTGKPAGRIPSLAEAITLKASTLQQENTGQKDGVGLSDLSDGGIGRKALSAHTKNEDNRRQFFQLYRRMARQVEIVGDTGVLSEEGRTPRQEFIRKMLAMGRMPVPILLRDPSALQDLNLAHRGLGDDVMCAAAEVLTRLPHINTLNVSDNRLTDRSLCKLCSLVVGMPGLKSLDLSCNKVDEAAAIIRGYLAHPDCSLQTLSLRSADVDDDECCFLMEAISQNQSLTKLDVSENKIGQNEMLNAVQPDVVTGGEGIAETLAGNVALKELNLSWNNLRQESAAAIGRALSLNHGLVSLNLAHNAFNNLPSQEVGDSLRSNSTLQSLDMSYNGLTPAATTVIACACKANISLTSLTMSGNRLGRQGSAALLRAIRKRTSAGKGRQVRPLLLGLEGCDCESDSPNLLDVDEPSGDYKLDMSLPYSRMVASELLALSESKKGFEIEGIWSAKDMESLDKPERRELVKTDREAMGSVSRLETASPCARAIAEIARKAAPPSTSGGVGGDGSSVAIADNVLNGYERSRAKEQVMKLLEAIELKPSRAAMDRALDEMDWSSIKDDTDAFFEVFRASFRVFDKDRSGSLEVDELLELFQALGCDMDKWRCSTLISAYDFDRSGVLEMEEFVTWILLEHAKDITCPKGKLLENTKARPWPVPREGTYLISFRASRFPADITHVESAEGLAAMVENIRSMNTATERLRMFENAAMHTDMLLTGKQAEMMALLVERDQDRVMTAERLLPQVVTSDERSQFLESFLNDRQRLRLALRMKGLFRAIMGNPTGFYTLDLASAQGRMTATKLGEIANAERSQAIARGARDTSQKGTRMMFRNEVMDAVPQNVAVGWFVKLPRRGIIRMDVVSTERPRLSVRPISDVRFESVKALLGVGDEMQQIKETYELLEEQGSSQYPGMRIWQRGEAARALKPLRPTFADAALPVQPSPTNGNSDENSSNEAAATVPTAPAGVSADSADSKPKRTEGAGGRYVAELPYHYDPFTILRTKEQHPKAAVPDVEIPDSITGSHATDHWQQLHASSHFCLEYVEAARQAQATPPAGARRKSTNVPVSAAVEGAGGSEATGGGAVGTGPGGGDRAALPGGGGGAARTGAAASPTRIYRWVFHRLVVLQTAATSAWYTCQQAMEIASAFPWQDFGRVQALVLVFSRIVDVENFSGVVLSAVRIEEKRELLHRLGILNVLNPVRPDGPYELDLKVWEDREWAKILIKLAVEEPGANWSHETYTHARGTPPIQGWLLPESWTREDEDMGGDGGPRRSGILFLRYITDASLGCIPKWQVRKALCARTLGGIKRVM